MNTILALALIALLPALAAKGKLYRGAWAGIAVLSLLVSFGFGAVSVDSTEEQATKQWLFDAFLSVAFSSFLATCFYRKVAITASTDASVNGTLGKIKRVHVLATILGIIVTAGVLSLMKEHNNTTPATPPQAPAGVGNDDAELLISSCGPPSSDDSSAYDNPRPPLVARIIEYKAKKVRFLFIQSGGKIGDPPPYRWKLMGITDMTARDPSKARVVSPEEAATRIPCWTEKRAAPAPKPAVKKAAPKPSEVQNNCPLEPADGYYCNGSEQLIGTKPTAAAVVTVTPAEKEAQCERDYNAHPWYVTSEDGTQYISAIDACSGKVQASRGPDYPPPPPPPAAEPAPAPHVLFLPKYTGPPIPPVPTTKAACKAAGGKWHNGACQLEKQLGVTPTPSSTGGTPPVAPVRALTRADRQMVVDAINARMRQDKLTGSAGIVGDVLTVHSDRANALRFHTLLENKAVMDGYRQLEITTLVYTNDADQKFVYDLEKNAEVK